ncbi:MAG: hypothetical protein KA100_01710 [Rickettsiales bacterium]|nr:hypothetical protein [Rickettsiales bacterium]
MSKEQPQLTFKEPAANAAAAIGFSLILQPVITNLINTGAKKAVEAKPYPVGLREVMNAPLQKWISDGKRTLKRRTGASIVPAMFSQQVADYFELSKGQLLAVNTLLETTIASTVFPEAKERFSGIAGEGTPESRAIFQANRPAQTLALGLRNSCFVGAVIAKDIGKDIAQENEKLLREHNISKENAEDFLTHSLRITFAALTSPLDRIFSQLSAGNLPALDVGKEVLKNVSRGNLPALCAGLVARTALVYTTSSTISYGKVFGPKLVEALENNQILQGLFAGELLIDPEKISPQAAEEIAAEVANVEEQKWRKLSEQIGDQFELGGFFSGEISQDRSAALTASQASIEKMKTLIAQAETPPPSPVPSQAEVAQGKTPPAPPSRG